MSLTAIGGDETAGHPVERAADAMGNPEHERDCALRVQCREIGVAMGWVGGFSCVACSGPGSGWRLTGQAAHRKKS